MQLLDRFIAVLLDTQIMSSLTEVSKVEQLRIATTTESPAEPDRMRHEPLLMLFIDFQAQCRHVCSSKRARSRQSLYPEMSSFRIQSTCATANSSHDTQCASGDMHVKIEPQLTQSHSKSRGLAVSY